MVVVVGWWCWGVNWVVVGVGGVWGGSWQGVGFWVVVVGWWVVGWWWARAFDKCSRWVL